MSGSVQNDIATISFEVSDTGIGISSEKLSTIFEKFSQADGSTTRKFGGTGLGLPISKSFIELMGGDLQVESTEGVGSCFKFSIQLPVHEVAAKPKPHLPVQSGANIPIVDDNPVNRQILTEMISHWKWDCAAVASAKAGLTALKRARDKHMKIDLIILDYKMPEYDGADFMKALRKHTIFDDIPVLVLSSVDGANLAKRMQNLGVAKFMTKPPRSSVLFDAITTLVHTKKLKDIASNESQAEATDLMTPGVKATPKSEAGTIDILIAEDNEINQLFISEVMKVTRYSYKIVENGQLALEAWKKYRPEAILMDISMPVLNGYEATQAIRDVEKAHNLIPTPIIAVTAHAMREDKKRCFDHGMNDHLTKPLRVEDLELLLEKWLSPKKDLRAAG